METENREERLDFICWVDVETTGVNHDTDELLEVAAVLTDMQGNEISRYSGPSLISFSDDELEDIIFNAPERVVQMHQDSGLFYDLANENEGGRKVSKEELDRLLSEWLDSLSLGRRPYLGGNSITLDRNFLEANTPSFFSMMHYRSLDQTSIMLFLGAAGISVERREGKYTHRAIDDICESIWHYQQSLGAVKELILAKEKLNAVSVLIEDFNNSKT